MVRGIAHITRILVPTDFSVGAEAACGLAARLAARAEADLILFHALPGVELLEEVGRGRGKSQLKVLEDVRDRLREWFERIVPLELRQPLTVEFKVKVGEPTLAIAWAAERSKADFILMATHGRTGLAHLLVGSVTGAVLRTVPVPVLTLQLGQKERPLAAVHRILWATDLSPVSEGAWRYAVTFAGVFAAEVVLVHAVRPGEAAASLQSVEQELRRRQQQVEGLGLRARWKVIAGPPTEAIVATAEAEQTDLIVMGTRGRTGLPHVLFGSVAEAVIRKAPCPVLAVQIMGRGEARKQGADQASA